MYKDVLLLSKERSIMTHAEKVQAYQKSQYQCTVPSVCTALWTQENWIAHIDREGEWLNKTYSLVTRNNTSEYMSRRDVFYMYYCFVSYSMPCKVVDNETQQTIACFLGEEL